MDKLAYSITEAAQVLGWQRIPCVDGQGRLRTVEEIHQEIWTAVSRLL